ncbi:sugar ABC transporter permease [Haloimpatiens sp. FM7330]|uniref:sugar ABC transporter permease n=1 Tax=Haloimpatiens sp. FM7330 TaxID=3298610 RepID=UPI003635B6B3
MENAVKKVSRNKAKRRIDHFFTHIVLLIITVLSMIPIWWIIVTSIDGKAVGLSASSIKLLPAQFSFKNYISVFNNPNFLTWLKNSLIFAGVTTLIVMGLVALGAYAYSRFNFPGKKAGMMFFLIVMMLPITTSLLPQYLMMLKLKLVGKYIGIILIYTAGNMTFGIWNLKGYFDTIPKSLEEAAIVDGASKIQVFTNVMLPLAAPAIAITALIVFTTVWTEFATAFIFVKSSSQYTLAMGLYNWASNPRNIPYPLFCAGAMVVALPVATLFMLFQKYIVSGLTAGGVKG